MTAIEALPRDPERWLRLLAEGKPIQGTQLAALGGLPRRVLREIKLMVPMKPTPAIPPINAQPPPDQAHAG